MTPQQRLAESARLLGMTEDEMAAALERNPRTYRRWLVGELIPPPAIWQKISAMMREHSDTLSLEADELDAWTPPQQRKPGRKPGA